VELGGGLRDGNISAVAVVADQNGGDRACGMRGVTAVFTPTQLRIATEVQERQQEGKTDDK